MKNIRNIAITLIAFAGIACTATQQTTATTITDTTGTICEVVLQSTEPALTSLCTTAVDVEQAIQALIAQHAADAGAGSSAFGGTASYQPSSAEIYGWLLAHGTKTVKH